MPKGFLSNIFPSAQDNVMRLRQSATDAVSDLSSQTHVTLIDAADAFRHKGRAGLARATAQLNDFARATRDLARQRPISCLAAAVALGCLIGLSLGLRAANQGSRR